jgi:ABC-type enterobactin transport system permease subunit
LTETVAHLYSQTDACYNTPTSSVVVGLCTGTFAAAAVSCSKNTTELVPVAIEAVIASFKTGVLVENVAQRLDSSQDLDQSWAVLVEGAASAQLVREFNDKSVRPQRLGRFATQTDLHKVYSIG